jgi:hypothetical protein
MLPMLTPATLRILMSRGKRKLSLEEQVKKIFTPGRKSVQLEAWDPSAMFQDYTGSIPVTDYGQGVGLRLDKSEGLVLGPELVTNGTFDTDSGWTKGVGWSISGGVAAIDGSNTAASYLSAITAPALTAGKSYEVSFTYSVSAGRIRLNPAVGATTALLTAGSSGQFKTILLSNGNGALSVQAVDAGTIATVDNLSIKELPGNHAYQTTATARAIYGRVPATGKNNILVNSVMAGGGAAPTAFVQGYGTGVSSPYGSINGNTQYRHTAAITSERPNFIVSGGALGTAGSITYSLFIDEILSGSPTILSMLYVVGPGGSTVAYFKNGVAANSGDLVSTGDRISAVLTSGGTSGNVTFRFGLGSGVGLAADVVFSRPMINVGDTALPYQNSVSDYDTTEDGVPTLYGLKYDKLDDGYIIPSMTFTQPVTTIRGQRILPNANASWLFFFDANSTATLWWEAAANGVNTNFNGASVGTPATYVNGTLVTPVTRDALYDATLDANKIVTTKGLTLGTVALKAGLYASPYQFGGWEFGFVICEGMTDEEIALTETYLNQHTGAY